MSAYPYVVGPTFYGQSENRKVNSISETTTIYTPVMTATADLGFANLNITIFPNPASDLVAIQMSGLIDDDVEIELLDMSGKLVSTSQIEKGSTIAYFDVQAVYEGAYYWTFYANGFKSLGLKVYISA